MPSCGSCAMSIGGHRGAPARTMLVFQVVDADGQCMLPEGGGCRAFPSKAVAEAVAGDELDGDWRVRAVRV